MHAVHGVQKKTERKQARNTMLKEWHDVNEQGFNFGKKKEDPKPKKLNTGVDDSEEPAKKEPPPVEYRIKYVRPIEPLNGFRHNKAYDIEGEIEPLVEKIAQPRILLYPVGIYKGKEDNFFPNGIEVFPDKDGKFRGMCNHLFNSIDYDNDYEKSDDATWVLVIRARGRTAEKDVESEPLTFPQPEKAFINLRKGHYDDKGASQHEKPREGDDYVNGDAVKLLQQDLIALRFLPRGEDDGFFGSKTDAAVKDFQKIAIDKYRMRSGRGSSRRSRARRVLIRPLDILKVHTRRSFSALLPVRMPGLSSTSKR